ncbi:MAG: dihydropteroate synthase [Bacteroidales bacterium]|nr:dihydropteroate synthase [Bacteroidales bacterium]
MEDKPDRKISIMGIVNLTDDSFYAGSRILGADGSFDSAIFLSRIDSMLSEGADIIDLGACSTRPGSESISEEVEWRRLEPALSLLASERPGLSLSIDSFRPGLVSKAFDIVGPFIVNDVSGGSKEMWRTVGELGLEYVAMHTRGTPKDMQSLTDYDDILEDVKSFFRGIAQTADKFGVKDWILDPGFGFAKTVGQNWLLLRELAEFKEFGRPILAGLSRKSFLYKPLDIGPEDALPATCAANLIALQNGASILRVHDVAPARQIIEVLASPKSA